MRNKWVRLAWVLLLILLPIIIGALYRHWTALPARIVIAAGAPGGAYYPLARHLAEALETRLRDRGHQVEVTAVSTEGSLENLQLLQAGRVQFGLYQPGTHQLLAQRAFERLDTTGDRALTINEFNKAQPDRLDPDAFARLDRDRDGSVTSPEYRDVSDIAFVANLYSQPVHLVVRRGAEIETPADLAGKRVSLGLPQSGDLAMSLALLEHFGLEDGIDPIHWDYAQIVRGFQDETLDAAFLTLGIHASVFQDLAATGKCRLVDIPGRHGLEARYLFLYDCGIPEQLYRYLTPAFPAVEVQTVAVGAHLLARRDVPEAVIESMTRVVLDQHFIRENRLGELAAGGAAFSQQKPGFPVHRGTRRVYDARWRPLLDPDFVESTEGLRSFAVSVCIALFLAVRWIRTRKIRRQEHRLDRYMRSLLDIERRQIGLDDDAETDDVEPLQRLLDEVTLLRQEALSVFSAHELREDTAADCFIGMCHALSNKINAKISRQRLERRFGELAAMLDRREGPPSRQGEGG